MKVVGIVAEYNPFHLGHEYQLRYAKETLGADYCIVVMSGPFTQRGTPALFDKYTRASHALACGADLVLGLPVIYATASAEAFALGAVSVLENTGIVDTLLFGCEADDITPLKEIASLLVSEQDDYKKALQAELANGKAFAEARAIALNHPEYASLINTPNNILAVEYLKALKRLNSSIEPIGLKRKGSGYHDETLQSPMASATAIRKAIFAKDDFLSREGHGEFLQQIPLALQDAIVHKLQEKEYLSQEDPSLLVHYALMKANNFSNYVDCSKELSNKILRSRHLYASFDSFCQQLKSKDIAYARVSRVLCHILLGIQNDMLPTKNTLATPSRIAPYLRILGFSNTGRSLLPIMKERSSVPILTTPKEAEKQLDHEALSILQKDIFASDVYRMLLSEKTGCVYPNEFTRKFTPLQNTKSPDE